MPKAYYSRGTVVTVLENCKNRMEIDCIKERSGGNNCTAKENPNSESGLHMPQQAGVVLPILQYQGLGSPLINIKTSYRAIYYDCKYSETNFVKYLG